MTPYRYLLGLTLLGVWLQGDAGLILRQSCRLKIWVEWRPSRWAPLVIQEWTYTLVSSDRWEGRILGWKGKFKCTTLNLKRRLYVAKVVGAQLV